MVPIIFYDFFFCCLLRRNDSPRCASFVFSLPPANGTTEIYVFCFSARERWRLFISPDFLFIYSLRFFFRSFVFLIPFSWCWCIISKRNASRRSGNKNGTNTHRARTYTQHNIKWSGSSQQHQLHNHLYGNPERHYNPFDCFETLDRSQWRVQTGVSTAAAPPAHCHAYTSALFFHLGILFVFCVKWMVRRWIWLNIFASHRVGFSAINFPRSKKTPNERKVTLSFHSTQQKQKKNTEWNWKKKFCRVFHWCDRWFCF